MIHNSIQISCEFSIYSVFSWKEFEFISAWSGDSLELIDHASNYVQFSSIKVKAFESLYAVRLISSMDNVQPFHQQSHAISCSQFTFVF